MGILAITKRHNKGQSLVELAISLLFLILLISGIVNIGTALFTFMAMRDAAQEGASYGVIGYVDEANGIIPTKTYCDQVINRTRDAMPNIPANVVVTIVDTNGNHSCQSGADMKGIACFSHEIIVETHYDTFPITMPFLGAILNRQTIPLRAIITGTIVGPPC